MGDNAEMCIIELVDFNTLYTKEATTLIAKKTRRGKKVATAGDLASSKSVEATNVATTTSTEEAENLGAQDTSSDEKAE